VTFNYQKLLLDGVGTIAQSGAEYFTTPPTPH